MSAHQESRSLHKAQTARREAHGLGDFLRDIDIWSVQKEVVGDQGFARAHNGCAGCGMHARLAKIRLACRICRNLVANPFELATPNVFEILPFGRGCSGLVKVNRNLKSLRDLSPDVLGHRHAVLECDAVNGDEGNDIGGTHAGVRPVVLGQIDQFCGLANSANGGFFNRLALAHQRNHAAVVVGVHLPVEKIDVREPSSPRRSHRPSRHRGLQRSLEHIQQEW